MNTMKWIVALIALTTVTGFTTTAFAQDSTGEETAVESGESDEGESSLTAKDVPPMKAADMGMLDTDLMLAAGFGSWIYPHIEPSVDIGIAPLGPVTISAGASMDVGWCLLCGLVSALSELRVNSWYAMPQARLLVHANALNHQFKDLNVDTYGGVTLGPAFYNFTLGTDNSTDEADVDIVTFIGGPVIGGRLFTEKIALFGFVELRYLLETGFGETTVTIDNQEFTLTNAYNRAGPDITFGIGYRL
jgi:hypothetical protein